MPDPVSEDEPPRLADPGLWGLFLGFSGIAIVGFGGVLPFARRMLVEKKRWMTGDEFNEAYSLAQFLPGGNILNLSVVVGRRFHGASGALMAVLGLLAGPVVIVTILGLIYFSYGQVAVMHDALLGVAAGAAGLIIAMSAKMAEPLIRRREIVPLAIAGIVFVLIAGMELPLMPVLAVCCPVAIAIAWRRL